MPKLKTHHWAGMTLSMKNLFGLVPGVKYGWPDNSLHMGMESTKALSISTARCALISPSLTESSAWKAMAPSRASRSRQESLFSAMTL